MTELQEDMLVTGSSGHEIYVVRNRSRHWVPDTWTMMVEGLSPRDLLIVPDELLDELPLGGALPTAVPSPQLPDGTIVVTESGTWQAHNGYLDGVDSPQALVTAAFDLDHLVVWLPDSVVRSARRRSTRKTP